MSEARAPAEQRGTSPGGALRRFMVRPEAPALVFLAVLVVAFSLSSDKFLSGANFESIVDRKSTRLNSSHANISYAVFCLKKKRKGGTRVPSQRRWPSRRGTERERKH